MNAVGIVVGLLKAEPIVTGLLAAGADSVHAIAAPQKAPRPSVIVVPLSEVETVNLAGNHDGQPAARLVIMVRASTAADALAIGDVVVRSLKDCHTYQGQRIQFVRDPVDRTEPEAEALFVRTVGFTLHYGV